jgi:hypothetical protein
MLLKHPHQKSNLLRLEPAELFIEVARRLYCHHGASHSRRRNNLRGKGLIHQVIIDIKFTSSYTVAYSLVQIIIPIYTYMEIARCR